MTKPLRQTAAELRSQFDAAFARAPSSHDEIVARLVLARAGARWLTLPAEDLVGLRGCPTLTVVPSRSASLLGLGAVGGALVAVHQLASFVGGEASGDPPRWVAMVRCDPALALALDALEGYHEVRASELVGAPPREARPYVSNRFRHPARGLLDVLDVPAIAAELQRVARLGKGEEGSG